MTGDEIGKLYRTHYELTRLAVNDLPDGLQGKCAARENVWLLRPARID